MKFYVMIAITLVAANCYAISDTDSMQCKKGIVSTGDSMLTVINKCGQPTIRTGVYMKYKTGGKTRIASEQWLYNFGPSSFQYYAYFDGATVALLQSTSERGF